MGLGFGADMENQRAEFSYFSHMEISQPVFTTISNVFHYSTLDQTLQIYFLLHLHLSIHFWE